MINEENAGLTARIETIAEKLSQLRNVDRTLSVFGSDFHKYVLGPTLSEEALFDCEQHLGVQLPNEYRNFVSRVGHGGAGPYYGLFSLLDRDSEDITDADSIRKPFRWTEAFNPYDWEDPCDQEDVWCDDDVEEGERPQVILKVPGALYICHYGCAIRFFLIVKGRCLGEVWRDSQADDAGIKPECGGNGKRLGFLGWYEKWLDEALVNQSR
jgi:hypothetical protein